MNREHQPAKWEGRSFGFTDLWSVRPAPCPEAVVQGKDYRITVLTSRLLRLEYEPDGHFLDSATQVAICREFPCPAFETRLENGWLVLETEALILRYDQQPFSAWGLSVTLKDSPLGLVQPWKYGVKQPNLGGTARTLDRADGAIPLDDGLISRTGFAVLDDGASMLMDASGALQPPVEHGIDLYLFAYGQDYKGCLRDFFHLSGKTPPVPRFALGNWWSRYYPYTEESYRTLMERFEAEDIPLSVAVLDMNWHVTDVDPSYGSGWTGYTWDKQYFPEPERLLRWLHEKNLKVTLNDHPADGIRACEDKYPAVAEAMGIDPASKAPISFDASSADYWKAFEEQVLEPIEKQGVDFWWIDWQQEGGTSVPGVDPLFVLNHRRYLHGLKEGGATLAFSRYGGPGSHRYPIGFSGDTVVSWESLAFQPYFTANAANIGYSWWSHDIGGHMRGYHDEELTVRWVQFGVFSPIMRLHSSLDDFIRKEPWLFSPQAGSIMKRYLRLRHRLVPWLYTQNLLCSRRDEVFLRHVYFDYADDEVWKSRVYQARYSEYLLGDSLLVCPITAPGDQKALLGHADVWLPEGEWVDFFNGWRYQGEQQLQLYRTLEDIPVLVKAGAIIPMDGAEKLHNGTPLPETVQLRVFAGADGEAVMLEDNGLMPIHPDYAQVQTAFRLHWGDGAALELLPPEGELSLLPENRRYTVELVGVDKAPDAATCAYSTQYDAQRRTLTLSLSCDVRQGAVLTWHTLPACPKLNMEEQAMALLFPARMEHTVKDDVIRQVRRFQGTALLAALEQLHLPEALHGALVELTMVR